MPKAKKSTKLMPNCRLISQEDLLANQDLTADWSKEALANLDKMKSLIRSYNEQLQDDVPYWELQLEEAEINRLIAWFRLNEYQVNSEKLPTQWSVYVIKKIKPNQFSQATQDYLTMADSVERNRVSAIVPQFAGKKSAQKTYMPAKSEQEQIDFEQQCQDVLARMQVCSF